MHVTNFQMFPHIRANDIPYLVQIGHILIRKVVIVSVATAHILVDSVQIYSEKIQEVTLKKLKCV